jgi:putative membrane protein
MDFRPHDFVNDGLGWLHGLFWLLIVVAVVAGTFLIVRLVLEQPRGRAGWPGHASTSTAALAELDLRYARGEVDRADYLQRRADLLGLPGPEHASPPHSGPTRPAKP